MQPTPFSFLDQNFQLHPCGGMYWVEKQTLLIADLHLGKSAHFRKAGIAVPRHAGDVNWDKLYTLLFDFLPNRVVILGDLFHSVYNAKWEEWLDFTTQFSHIDFVLVLGNHDILSAEKYTQAGLTVFKTLIEFPFYFTHEPEEKTPDNCYNLCGHIHPCVFLHGRGKERMRLPCFYFGKKGGILPAFGDFTGMFPVSVSQSDTVFVLTEDCVIRV